MQHRAGGVIEVDRIINHLRAVVGILIRHLRKEGIVTRTRGEREQWRRPRHDPRRARRRAGVRRASHGRRRNDERMHNHKINAGENDQHDQHVERAVEELLCAASGHVFIIEDEKDIVLIDVNNPAIYIFYGGRV